MRLRHRAGRRTNRRGISLVEILICVVILAFALIPAVNMMTTTARSSAFTEYHLFWQVRASRILEKARQIEYPQLILLRQADGTLPIHFEEPPIPEEYSRLLRNWKETCRLDEISPGLARITVAIEWSFPMDRGAKARPHKLTLSQLVSDPILTWRCRDGLKLETSS